MDFDLTLQALRVTTEALATLLNTEKATNAQFEEGDELAGFEFDGDDGFELTTPEDAHGGVCFERGQWIAWHQEHA